MYLQLFCIVGMNENSCRPTKSSLKVELTLMSISQKLIPGEIQIDDRRYHTNQHPVPGGTAHHDNDESHMINTT